jgi:hypothetical protein
MFTFRISFHFTIEVVLTLAINFWRDVSSNGNNARENYRKTQKRESKDKRKKTKTKPSMIVSNIFTATSAIRGCIQKFPD